VNNCFINGLRPASVPFWF